jgi:CBS domain-containing protein
MRRLSGFTIREFYRIDEEPPIIVTLEDDFARVIRSFALSSELRGIFVTDRDDQFVGVITRVDLLDWTRVQVGDFFGESSQSPNKTLRLSRIINAATVGEVMHPGSVKAAVRLEDTAKDAMRKMIELDIIVLPVIDDANRIIGDIKLSEILEVSLGDIDSE